LDETKKIKCQLIHGGDVKKYVKEDVKKI